MEGNMSYINCHKCKKKYHVKAGNCPHCNVAPEQPSAEVAPAEPEKTIQKPTAPKGKNLTKCKDCGHQVSKKAPACPSCGAVLKKESKPLGCGGLILIVFIIGIFASIFSSSDPAPSSSNATSKPSKTAAKISEEAACKTDLQCWGSKHNLEATIRCDGEVEKLAKYSHEWTDGILEAKFSHFRWKNKPAGIVTYIGDKIKFQNGFGAYQAYTYECDFDTIAKQAVAVRAEPGRL